MRILHFGDMHYSEAKHRRVAADGIDQGWHDVARCVDHLIDAALNMSGPVVVAFGGDLSLDRRPRPETYQHFGRAITRLHRAGIPMIGIPGNHDVDKAVGANALDPLEQIPGFHLFNEPGVAYLQATAEGARVHGNADGVNEPPAAAIVCVPWLQRSIVATKLPEGTPLEEVLDAMSTAAMSVIRELASTPISKGIPTFLLYHGTVTGGKTPSGRSADAFLEPKLGAHDLGNLGLSGVMLNHLHCRQDLGSKTPGATPIAYSSSVERLTFNDEDDPKGGIVWTVPGAGKPAELEYLDTPARRFVTITDMGQLDVQDAIVRARLQNDRDSMAQWDAAEVERSLLHAGAHRVTEIVIESADHRVEHEAADLARTDPLEALASWIDTEHPDADTDWRSRVLDDAAQLLGLAPEAPLPDVPHAPVTDEEIAALPVLDLDALTA